MVAIMNNKVYLGKDEFIYVEIFGDQTYESIHKTAEEIEEVIQEIKKQKAYLLVDLSRMTKQDSGARKAAQEGLNFIHYDKMAIFAAPLFLKNVARFLVLATGKTNVVGFFKTEEEAIRWLKA